jgi:2-polyprenyl-3-methyl-5-hydroxy-6-metoxy-1,4-benzoquinol methylase
MYSNREYKKEAKLGFADTNGWVVKQLHGRVLDYGCGEGSLRNVDTGDLRVEGYDIDPDNKTAKYHSLDEINILGAQGRFDCILMSHVIEHMELDESIEMLKWCKQRCGRIVIVTPNEGNNIFIPFHIDITHVKSYATPDLMRVMESLGYKNCKAYLGGMDHNPMRIAASFLLTTSPYWDYIVVADA